MSKRIVRFRPWPLFAVIAVGLAFMVLGYLRYAPPEIRRSDDSGAENTEFSLTRTLAIWEDLVGDGIPHPAGTLQNEIVRKRIIDHVEGFGLTVQQQVTSGVTWRTKETVPLVNLLIYLPGTDPVATIALTSHHDSTAAGPGAADNAAAVAISLELARYYRDHPAKNNILFLITDGEELGLLGAEKFVREHPLANTIDLVVNLEARGTSGPSCMFETGEASLWSIRHYAAIAQRPIASSLFYEVYRLLPNNTDFTRYKELPIQGWNFAFIGDVKNYHTPDDNVSVVDHRSIGHHAEHAQALLQRFANSGDLDITYEKAVYFDYLGLRLFYWDQAYSFYLALLPTLLIASGFAVVLWKKQVSIMRLAYVFIWMPLLTVLLLASLWLTFESLRWQDYISPPWPTYPLPIFAVFWFVALGVAVLGCRLAVECGREVFFVVAFVGFAFLWLATLYVPGASYLMLVPCLVGSGAVWLLGGHPMAASLLIWVAIAAIWLPLEALFYDALGFHNREVVIGRMIFVTIGATPVLAYCWETHVTGEL